MQTSALHLTENLQSRESGLGVRFDWMVYQCPTGRLAYTAAAVLPKQTVVGKGNSQKTFYKTFKTTWRPRLYKSKSQQHRNMITTLARRHAGSSITWGPGASGSTCGCSTRRQSTRRPSGAASPESWPTTRLNSGGSSTPIPPFTLTSDKKLGERVREIDV